MSDISFDGGKSNGPVLQSALGTFNSTHTQQDRNWNHGYLAFGKVLNVYPKRYTADVEIFQTSDKLHSTHEQEGRHGCKIGVSTAGFSDLYQAPYGEITPIQRGNIVLVGFLKNTKEQPVILRVFHDTAEEVGSFNFRNILLNYFSAYSNIGDILDYLKITPIQDFLKVDRFGNIELSSHTKSFFVATESNIVDDKFDYEDLSPKFPKDKTVINPLPDISDLYDMNSTGQSYYNWGDDAERRLSVETIHVDEKHSKPKKYMAVFRDNYTDSLTNWLRVIIDAAHTSFRILKVQQQDNHNTMFDVTEDGTIKVRRQLDTRLLFDPQTPQTKLNPTQNPCKIYSEMQMLSDGTIKIETTDRTLVTDPNLENGFSSEVSVGADQSKDFPHTLITIHPKGGNIVIETNSKIKAYAKTGIDVNSKGDINVFSEKTINIGSLSGINIASNGDVNVNSQTTTRVSAVKDVEMFAPDMYLTGAMDMKGSIDMKGEIDVVGNANFTGRHRINHRGAILDGDEDTHLDTNLEFHCNYLVDIIESFMIKKLCRDMSMSTVNASAIMGIFNVATNGFTMEGTAFDGIATTMETAAFGALFKESSPYHADLINFCKDKIFGSNSISVQIDFLNNPQELGGLGIDLNNLGIDTGEPFATIVSVIQQFWTKFGRYNDLATDSAKILAKSTERSLSPEKVDAFNQACQQLNLQLMSTVDSAEVRKENTTYNEWWGSRSTFGNVIKDIVHENDQTKVNPDTGHSDSGTGIDDVKVNVATIEDALTSTQGYFNTRWNEAVKTIEEAYDAQISGSNSAQYANTNRKIATTTGGDGSSGSGGTTTYKPASINNEDQYVDRLVKRYVFSVCEKLLKQINEAWKYYTYGL